MTECVKKKLSLPFFILHFLFVFCLLFRHHFFCPLWLFRNQRERRDVFIHTHTRTEEEERLLRELLQREREREREREKEHGEERGNKTLRFVSMQQKRKRKEDFCFTRDDVVERSFFLTYSFRGAPVF